MSAATPTGLTDAEHDAVHAEHAETPAEEVANAITHGVGGVLAVAVAVALQLRASGPADRAVSAVFGASLVLVYATSAAYHLARTPAAKRRAKKLDHAAIYGLIAGTYTPFLVALGGGRGVSLLVAVWLLAAVGVGVKLWDAGRFGGGWLGLASVGMYVAMGWIGLLAFGPLMASLPPAAGPLLVGGGVLYTGGVAFYLWDALPFNHAVWHAFVLAGSACHAAAVWLRVG